MIDPFERVKTLAGGEPRPGRWEYEAHWARESLDQGRRDFRDGLRREG